jgi:hypothetical protein
VAAASRVSHNFIYIIYLYNYLYNFVYIILSTFLIIYQSLIINHLSICISIYSLMHSDSFCTNFPSRILVAYSSEWVIQIAILILYLSLALAAKEPNCPAGYNGPGIYCLILIFIYIYLKKIKIIYRWY